MCRVTIDAQASPGQVVRYFRGKIERRPAEHLGQITGDGTDVVRKYALWPTTLDDVDDVRIRRQVLQRWEKHDERQSAGSPLDERMSFGTWPRTHRPYQGRAGFSPRRPESAATPGDGHDLSIRVR